MACRPDAAGKPKNASPRTSGSGSIACACEVMRPPNDFPPAISGSPGQRARLPPRRPAPPRARPPAHRAACCPSPCRETDSASVAMPRSASPIATVSMNGCAMPAPAPWANTKQARALSGRSSSAETEVVFSRVSFSRWAVIGFRPGDTSKKNPLFRDAPLGGRPGIQSSISLLDSGFAASGPRAARGLVGDAPE